MSVSVANTLWARSFVDELARAGVRDVVVAPGSRSTPLVMAFARDDRFCTRVHLDERSLAFFALGVGKASGCPAVVVTTSGTAVANVFPAVVEASQSGVPLLVLTADRPHRLRDSDANQAVDQVGIYGGFVRAFFDVAPPTTSAPELRHLRALAGRAYAAAVGPDAGPVHLNFPFDKPLEPQEADAAFVAEHLLAATGRADGAPFVDVTMTQGRPSSSQLATLRADILDTPRGVIIAGPAEDAERVGPAVLSFAAALGYMVLADPLSGARYGPSHGAHVVAAYDLFLRDQDVRGKLTPTVIVRVGASPTSAALQQWLLDHDCVRHIVIDGSSRWKDHGTTATQYVCADPAETLDALTDSLTSTSHPSVDAEWASRWQTAESAALGALANDSTQGDVHEGDVLNAVLDAVPAQGNLFVSSSMPIRDLDAFGHPSEKDVRVFANRGASGIDGIVSTAFGVASRCPEPTVCVLGDVAFFHDQTGLLWSREQDAAVVFVLIDNDGGGIFHNLPIADHEPAFTRFFSTPHGIDARHAASAHGLDFTEVAADDVSDEVVRALSEGGTRILRVRTEREANHRRHREVQAAVAHAVRDALA